DRVLEQSVDILPLDEIERVATVSEQGRDRLACYLVALVFEPMNLDQVLLEPPEGAQMPQGIADLLALLADNLRLLARDVGRLLDAIQDAGIGHLLDQIEHVVEPADQVVNVLAVERRDE